MIYLTGQLNKDGFYLCPSCNKIEAAHWLGENDFGPICPNCGSVHLEEICYTKIEVVLRKR